MAVKITMEENATSGTSIAGLHMLPNVAFGTGSAANIWFAQVGFPRGGPAMSLSTISSALYRRARRADRGTAGEGKAKQAEQAKQAKRRPSHSSHWSWSSWPWERLSPGAYPEDASW